MTKVSKTGSLVFSQKPRIFHGYWIVLVGFFCVFIFSGCGSYAFSLFIKPLQAEFGWGRGDIMVAFAILFLVMGAASPFTGRLVDRYGARNVIALGAVLVGGGFVMLSQVGTLWHYYVGYAVIGIGEAAIGPIPATAVVSNWFKKYRGTAIGIMSSGVGVGGFVVAPLVGGFIIPDFGWRAAYLAIAVLTCVILLPLALFVIKTKPADMGLYPDGAPAPEATTEAKASHLASDGLTLKITLATSAFWFISIAFLAGGFSQLGQLESQVPHLDDIGFSVVIAAGALGGVGLGSAAGKFFFGWLCDKIQAKYALSIGFGLNLVALIILMRVTPSTTLAVLWFYAIIMGLGLGSWMPTLSMIISTNFGLVAYGAILGMVFLFQNIGIATGPLLAGYLYDMTNTYQWAFVVFLILFVVAILAALAVRRPKII